MTKEVKLTPKKETATKASKPKAVKLSQEVLKTERTNLRERLRNSIATKATSLKDADVKVLRTVIENIQNAYMKEVNNFSEEQRHEILKFAFSGEIKRIVDAEKAAPGSTKKTAKPTVKKTNAKTLKKILNEVSGITEEVYKSRGWDKTMPYSKALAKAEEANKPKEVSAEEKIMQEFASKVEKVETVDAFNKLLKAELIDKGYQLTHKKTNTSIEPVLVRPAKVDPNKKALEFTYGPEGKKTGGSKLDSITRLFKATKV